MPKLIDIYNKKLAELPKFDHSKMHNREDFTGLPKFLVKYDDDNDFYYG